MLLPRKDEIDLLFTSTYASFEVNLQLSQLSGVLYKNSKGSLLLSENTINAILDRELVRIQLKKFLMKQNFAKETDLTDGLASKPILNDASLIE